MTKSARDWANFLIAVPKSMEATSPFGRLMRAERRLLEAERELAVAERENQRQSHLIAMMLDEVGGSLKINANTMDEFDAHRTIRTEVNLQEDSLRVWVVAS